MNDSELKGRLIFVREDREDKVASRLQHILSFESESHAWVRDRVSDVAVVTASMGLDIKAGSCLWETCRTVAAGKILRLSHLATG